MKLHLHFHFHSVTSTREPVRSHKTETDPSTPVPAASATNQSAVPIVPSAPIPWQPRPSIPAPFPSPDRTLRAVETSAPESRTHNSDEDAPRPLDPDKLWMNRFGHALKTLSGEPLEHAIRALLETAGWCHPKIPDGAPLFSTRKETPAQPHPQSADPAGADSDSQPPPIFPDIPCKDFLPVIPQVNPQSI